MLNAVVGETCLIVATPSVLASLRFTFARVEVPVTESVPGIIDPPLLCIGPEEIAFDPSNQNS